MNADFKKRLNNLENLFGVLTTLPSAETAELMSRVGYDWLWIDLEHGAIDWPTAQVMAMAVGDKCASIVRVPANDPTLIKRTLDMGCDGVVIPMVNSAAEAEAAVAACKYPPQGIRSVGVGRAHDFGLTWAEYAAQANDRVTVFIQIEHIEAVNRVEEIISVTGLDGIFLGPADLAASMGLGVDMAHPEVVAAMAEVIRACRAKGLSVGSIYADAEQAKQALDQGCNVILLGSAEGYMWRGAQAMLNEVKG